MKQQWVAFSGACALVLFAGCSAGGDAGGEPASELPGSDQAAHAQSRLLASVDLGYGTAEFREVTLPSGERAISLIENTSAFVRRTPLDALLAQQSLTNLEIFLAIAPNQTPPVELVNAQSAEAQALQRSDVSVIHALYDANAPVEKSPAACDSFAFSPIAGSIWINQQRLNSVTGSTFLPIGLNSSDFGHAISTVPTLAVCNEGVANVTANAWIDKTNDSGGFFVFSSTTIGPFSSSMFRTVLSTVGPDQTCGPSFCVPTVHPCRYTVQGVGAPGAVYDLRTAESQPFAIIR